MNLVLLGAPGAGKDTLADQMKKIYGFQVLTTGALYRAEKEKGTELGLKAFSYWGQGNLCPDDMTNELMQSVIAGGIEQACIFNGYPRTVEQAYFLDELTDIALAINISVNDETAIQRMLSRGRSGETAEVISQRLKVYETTGADVRDFYSIGNRLITVDGSGTREETFAKVFHSILAALHRL